MLGRPVEVGGLVYLCWVLLWFCLVRVNLVDEVIRLNSKGNAIRYSNLRTPFCNHRNLDTPSCLYLWIVEE